MRLGIDGEVTFSWNMVVTSPLKESRNIKTKKKC